MYAPWRTGLTILSRGWAGWVEVEVAVEVEVGCVSKYVAGRSPIS